MSKIEQRPRSGYFTSLDVAGYPIPKDSCGFRRTIPREEFFLVVDAYSKWMEVIPMSRTTTEATIQALRGFLLDMESPKS